MTTNNPGLRDRSRGAVATTNGGAAVGPYEGADPTVAQLIDSQKSALARALPRHMDADKLARIAITVVKQNPALMNCDAVSLLGALMTSAQLGLEPGPLGEAYLVPFGSKVTFIPGYRGLIKLAWQSGMLSEIFAEVVYEGDEFRFAYGLNSDLHHVPNFNRPRNAHPIAVYAVAKFKDGGYSFRVMSASDVEAIRQRSRSKDNGPWKTDTDAMWRKTAVRQLARWLPMSTELQTFQQAAERDGTIRSDYTEQIETADARQVDDQPTITQGPHTAQARESANIHGGETHLDPQEANGTTPDEAPADRFRGRGYINKAQHGKLMAQFGELNITTHDGRIAFCQNVTGADASLESTMDLTSAEASQVIDAQATELEIGRREMEEGGQ